MTGDRDRAVSTAVTHSLTLGITAILISTLLLGSGQLLASQEDRAAREQLAEIGSDVVSHINDLDRLNATGEEVNMSLRPVYPDQVVGEQYRINITDDESAFPFEADYALEIRSRLLDRPLQYPLQTDTDLDVSGQADGGEVTICLADDEISIGRGCR